MPQWGSGQYNGVGTNNLPKNLSLEQKTRVYADNRGWIIIRPGHRDASAGRHGKGEVIVALHGLQTNIGSSNVTAAYFVSTSYSTGATGKVRVHWDQLVTPLTTGTLIVKQQLAGTSTVTNITATRAGNSTSNFVEYAFTAPSTTGATLWIAAQTITGAVNAPNTSTAGVAASNVTASGVIATANVIVAGTKFRTAYGTNVLGTTSPFTNTSVTTTV